MAKTLANCSGFAKFTKVFPCHCFELYGMLFCLQDYIISQSSQENFHFNEIDKIASESSYKQLKLWEIYDFIT